jgi:hypothetical protein
MKRQASLAFPVFRFFVFLLQKFQTKEIVTTEGHTATSNQNVGDGSMESLWTNLAEIIKAIPDSPVIVSLLAIVILATLGFFLFNRDKSNYRLVVFLAVFISVVAILLLLLVSWRQISPVSFYRIPKDSTYASFYVYLDDTTLDQCQSKAKASLLSAGYSESEIRVGGGSIFGGSYFNTKEGIGSALWCTAGFGRQQIHGFTYGYDANLVSSVSLKVRDYIKGNSNSSYVKNLIDVSSLNFYIDNSEVFLDASIDNCLNRIRKKLDILGLKKLELGGAVLTATISDGTFAVGCKQYSFGEDMPIDSNDNPQFAFGLTYLAVGNSNSEVFKLRERFVNLLDDLPTIQKIRLEEKNNR